MRIEGVVKGSWEKVARRWASWGEAARRRRGGGGAVGRDEEGVGGTEGEGDSAGEGGWSVRGWRRDGGKSLQVSGFSEGS